MKKYTEEEFIKIRDLLLKKKELKQEVSNIDRELIGIGLDKKYIRDITYRVRHNKCRFNKVEFTPQLYMAKDKDEMYQMLKPKYNNRQRAFQVANNKRTKAKWLQLFTEEEFDDLFMKVGD